MEGDLNYNFDSKFAKPKAQTPRTKHRLQEVTSPNLNSPMVYYLDGWPY